MGIFVLFALIVLCLLEGMGIVFGLFLLALSGTLVVTGMVSLSAALGFWFRRPSTAVHAFIYQVALIAGIPCSIAVTWIVTLIFKTHESPVFIFLLGGAVGLTGGLLLAYVSCYVFDSLRDYCWHVWENAFPREKIANVPVSGSVKIL